MLTVILVCWHAEEAAPRIAGLEKLGCEVRWLGPSSSFSMKNAGADGVSAIVIDLGRLPSHGVYCAEHFRKMKRFRSTPILFILGDPAKMDAIRAAYTLDTFTTWPRLAGALKKAIAAGEVRYERPPKVARPERSLAQKLNLKAGSRVYLKDAPREFFTALRELPDSLEWLEEQAGSNQALLFFDDPDQLYRQWDLLSEIAARHSFWLVYRKGVFKLPELNEAIRDSGLASFKICAINANWTGIQIHHSRKERT
ncbi:hypothetical protein [Bryobacter aggregatus]|uniref:hypothetical protein n=1 Tax=Bryobacter aggregatus TaxID=360054 RepID=UPI00056C53BA|nr:hypothetical protein [Bryobacter aggregatus]